MSSTTHENTPTPNPAPTPLSDYILYGCGALILLVIGATIYLRDKEMKSVMLQIDKIKKYKMKEKLDGAGNENPADFIKDEILDENDYEAITYGKITGGHWTHTLFLLFKAGCGLFFFVLAYWYPFYGNTRPDLKWGIGSSLGCLAISFIIFIIVGKQTHEMNPVEMFKKKKLYTSIGILFLLVSIGIPSFFSNDSDNLLLSNPGMFTLESFVMGISLALGTLVIYVSRSFSAGQFKFPHIDTFFLERFIPAFLAGFAGNFILENSGINNSFKAVEDANWKFLPSNVTTYFVIVVVSFVGICFVMSLASANWKLGNSGTGFTDKIRNIPYIGKTLAYAFNNNILQFFIEGILLGIIGAGPIWLIEYNRNPHFLEGKPSIMLHFIELIGKIFICHLILQFTGVYKNFLIMGKESTSEAGKKREKKEKEIINTLKTKYGLSIEKREVINPLVNSDLRVKPAQTA